MIEPDLIGCADGCKRSVTPKEAEQGGWTYLSIQNRWRCPTCWRELQAANRPASDDALHNFTPEKPG